VMDCKMAMLHVGYLHKLQLINQNYTLVNLRTYLCQKVLVSCLSHTPPSLTFSDQYAFRPTGSTSAALIIRAAEAAA